MKEFDRIKDMLYEEIHKIGEEDHLTVDCLHVLDKMVDIIKDISTIEAMDEEGYGQDYESRYSRDNGYSTRGNRMRYYDNYNGSSYRGGRSLRDGYSRDDAKHDMISKLEDLMHEARDEQDREAIRRLIDTMNR